MSSLPTSNERERFIQEYNGLATTLALYWDVEGQTDADLTEEYVAREYTDALKELLADGQRFLNQRELPMCLISSGANRWLPTEAAERQWLQALLDRVQAELDARGAGAKRA